ncbi:MAG TPA: PKD domain-containing protein, partial [Solirubrobacteraceae bacterium]
PPSGQPAPGPGPVAAFSISPNPAIRGLPVTFDASGSTAPPGGRIARYQWDLDGNGSLETDTADSPTATGTYLAQSTTITLQVTDDRGRTATAQRLLVPQRFDVVVTLQGTRTRSRAALRRGLALRISALPVTRRIDVALYRARAGGRPLGRRIAHASPAVRPNARGTIDVRWRLRAAVRRLLRPGRYVVVVQALPKTAFRPAPAAFTVAR